MSLTTDLTPNDIGRRVIKNQKKQGRLKHYINMQRVARVVYKTEDNPNPDHQLDKGKYTKYEHLEFL